MQALWNLVPVLIIYVDYEQVTLKLTFTTRCANCHSIARFEELSLRDSVMNLSLEHVEEAFLADLLSCLWPLQYRSRLVTESTITRHGGGDIESCTDGEVI